MALRSKSLFLYGFEVTSDNNAIDFRLTSGGTLFQATVPNGYYSLTSLANAISSAMRSASSATITVNTTRAVAGGTENRVLISSLSPNFEIYFGTGPRASTSIASLIGFPSTDQVGHMQYLGTSSAGTALQPDWWGKNWQPPELWRRNFGAVNISTSGEKEAIVFAIQEFMSVQFDFESETKAFNQWPNLINWMIKQRPFDFTPEITSPNTYYEVTLEKTADDGKGLGFYLKEMIPNYPFQFSTGLLTFRRRGVF